jgi:hypothetical protein
MGAQQCTHSGRHSISAQLTDWWPQAMESKTKQSGPINLCSPLLLRLLLLVVLLLVLLPLLLRRRHLNLDPNHVQAAFWLAAVSPGPQVSSCPPEVVSKLFDGYSDHFDDHLVNKLGYKTPGMLMWVNTLCSVCL